MSTHSIPSARYGQNDAAAFARSTMLKALAVEWKAV